MNIEKNKMEYIQGIADTSRLLETIRSYDEAGWELVSHTWVDGFFHLLFKEKP